MCSSAHSLGNSVEFDIVTMLGSGATAWAAVYFSLNGELKALKALVLSLKEELVTTRADVTKLEERIFDMVREK